MKHLRPRWIDEGGLTGEFGIEDLGVFLEGGSLDHVSKFWDATVAQAMMLDAEHDKRLEALSPEKAKGVGDPEMYGWVCEQHEILTYSDEYLLKANIFCLLLGFYEYALIEVYELVYPQAPLPDRPKLKADLLEPLKAKGVIGDLPDDYKKHVLDNRDAVRNAFAHGRWGDLKSAGANLDLHEAYMAVIQYFGQVEVSLKKLGFNP